jgi:CBS domain-containing protein
MTEMTELNGNSHVRRLVTGPTVSLRREQPLDEAAAVLAANDVGAAVVQSGNQSIGVISERDVIKALAPEGDDFADLRVADVMSPRVEMIEGSATILEASRRMVDGGIRHLGVSEGDAPLGLISMRDLLAVLASGDAASIG